MSLPDRIADLAVRIAQEVSLRGLPTGGAVGQYVRKTGPGNYEVGWGDAAGGGGGAYERQTVTLAAASGDGSMELAAGFDILSVTSSAPVRLRIYRTAASRAADAVRPANQLPSDDGVLLDYVFPVAGTAWINPQVSAHLVDATAYYRVDGTATLDITWQRTE